ncbi:MAG: hypothetical protein WKG07_33110 [Hymenobacter sp.]
MADSPLNSEQPAARGSGPRLERRYYIDVARPRLTPGPADGGGAGRFAPVLARLAG